MRGLAIITGAWLATLLAAAPAPAAPQPPPPISIPLGCKARIVEPAASAERMFVICGSSARVIETPSGRVIRAYAAGELSGGGKPNTSAISPRGDRLAIGLWDGGVLVWDVDRPGPPLRWKAPTYANTMLFTPDGRGLFVDGVLLDIGAALAPRTRLATDFDTISDVAVSPDGKRAAVPAADTKVRLYETAGWTPVAEYKELRIEPFAALFVDGGRRVLVGVADGRVLALDGRTLQRQGDAAGPAGYYVAALAPAGPGRVAVRYRAGDGRAPPKAAVLDLKTLAVTPQAEAAKADAMALRGGRLWLYRIDGDTLKAEPLP
jgi:hypothetical protein